MDSYRLLDDQPFFDRFPNLLMGVGIGHVIGRTGVQPDLLCATVEDPGGKSFLKPERTHGCSGAKHLVFFILLAFPTTKVILSRALC